MDGVKVELDELAHDAGSCSKEQAADDNRRQGPDEMWR